MAAASLTPCRVVTVIRLLSLAAGGPAVRGVRLTGFSLNRESGSLSAEAEGRCGRARRNGRTGEVEVSRNAGDVTSALSRL
ncbi:hypothetical protein Pmi06nite_71830 [Planotetraspora mira]|uniref:Uncharacterized protein n=1 Tax=Planotetraspora mira TaxID=58121 RepID=A0A8J3XAP5_9ACTN|nr:hypothetical protein Pmi06nite_71830 [Planotetraspora mira]